MRIEQLKSGELWELQEDLVQLLSRHEGRIALLTDENTLEAVAPLLMEVLGDVEWLSVPSGEGCKDIAVSVQIWEFLLEQKFGRSDLLITLGGGAVTDLGGWVASSYKRGIRLWHLPTSLLAMVDAAIGGKTAVNVGAVKNSVGSFYPAEVVWLCPEFLATLPHEELLSGWGEMIKYALLGVVELDELLAMDPNAPDIEPPVHLITQAAQAKQKIVAEDPYDRGIRQQLNLGHTVGHALEMLCTLTPSGKKVPHGVAVAAGIVCELYLSHKLLGYPQEQLTKVAIYVRSVFPKVAVSCEQFEALYALAKNDKKRSSTEGLSAILLDKAGRPTKYEGVTSEVWEEALGFYRDFMSV